MLKKNAVRVQVFDEVTFPVVNPQKFWRVIPA
jgi:hypothetical protein